MESMAMHVRWPVGCSKHMYMHVQVLSRCSVASAIALEIMRRDMPVGSVFRVAARDTTVAGVALPKGSKVVVNLPKVRMTTMHEDTRCAEWAPGVDRLCRVNAECHGHAYTAECACLPQCACNRKLFPMA